MHNGEQVDQTISLFHIIPIDASLSVEAKTASALFVSASVGRKLLSVHSLPKIYLAKRKDLIKEWKLAQTNNYSIHANERNFHFVVLIKLKPQKLNSYLDNSSP